MGYSKIVFGSKTLIDLTGDTLTADKLLEGITAHDKAGEPVVGACSFDVDSGDATVAVAEILNGKTGYARGQKLTGTMPNNGAVTGVIHAKNGEYAIPLGFHDGSGKVAISPEEKAKLIPGNIKSGITVLGVNGSYGGEAIKAQEKTVTPAVTQQTVQPDSGYDYLSAVTVSAIPYIESENSAGGTTVTIGGKK